MSAAASSPVGSRAWTGTNLHGELGNLTTLAMVSTDAPAAVVLKAGDQISTAFITVVVTSLNSTDTMADAQATYARATQAGAPALLASHAAAWAARWDQGSLEVEGDLFLAGALNSSLYAIRSAIRPDWPFGLSPGGLASDAYNGHTFWDQETWMYPPLLLLDPDCAETSLGERPERQINEPSNLIHVPSIIA
jgi:trehalose/maltose hydrolase-like predicted phosphorylase